MDAAYDPGRGPRKDRGYGVGEYGLVTGDAAAGVDDVEAGLDAAFGEGVPDLLDIAFEHGPEIGVEGGEAEALVLPEPGVELGG